MKAVRVSPRDYMLFPTYTVDLTPNGVRRRFFKLRELMKNYVQEERAKGVRVKLDYVGGSEVTFSP